ncbi:MAG: tetratricopeptide repeat protein [Candidatus Kariarchaeaceae archaeon]|jgi:tetratricopeptide (TPR) repeat protein
MVEAEQIRTETPKKRQIMPFVIHRAKSESRKFMIFWSILKILMFIWIITLFFNYLIWGIILFIIFIVFLNPFSDFYTRNNPYFLLEQITREEIDAKDAYSWYNRGLAYLKLGELELALVDFDQSTKIDASIPNVWAYKAACLFNKKEFSSSLKAIERAIQLLPEDIYFLSIKFNILKKLDREEEVIEIKQHIKELKEKNLE